ncbi:hypothetical protein CBR_g68747 [Chara braunii]|uniref:CCHC-type domain-containing protein n=1 Tax=Chara braunii TaxID=69332 RepID=A0A388K9R2_CHABU|nr:hypothetical protein CBR_g68747 [Chara braunii]|eukprot:GBG66761.1 hypothetical protein CBR_g68747 [Chara braunii]
MARYRDQRDYGHGDQRGYGSDEREYQGEKGGYDLRPGRWPITCFNCDETGHYANQCPHPRRQSSARASTSSDSRRDGSVSPRCYPWHMTPSDLIHSKVVEIGKSVAAVCQYVENEQQKKAAKECRKMEEAEDRAEADRMEVERKKKKKEEKAWKEAERLEDINKKMDIKVAVRVGELRDDVCEDVRQEILKAISEFCVVEARGKQKVVQPARSGSESSGRSIETEELSTRTRNLCITEKRKRGEEPVFEDSPPMELPPKRTPRATRKPVNFTSRLARSKAKAKTKISTPRKTPASISKKKISTSIGVVGQLNFEKHVMHELKNLDVLILQYLCRDEGIQYNGKFEAIFDIAAHHTKVAYGTEEEDEMDSPQGTEIEDTAEGDAKTETE